MIEKSENKVSHVLGDEHSFIELVDSMPALIETPQEGKLTSLDQRILEAARTSIAGKNVRAISKDERLLRYLMKNKHWTPFEFVRFTFGIRLPIFVARQWVRHRASSLNEESARYGQLRDDFYIPPMERLLKCGQAKENKQGSGVDIEPAMAELFEHRFKMNSKNSYEEYEQLLKDGCARELARIVLPTNIYCYSDDTEVLTHRGFVKWPDVKESDRLGTYDPKADSLCYELPEYLTVQDYTGPMYQVKHRSIDLLTTPRHKLWVSKSSNDYYEFSLVPANEVGHDRRLRFSKVASLRDGRPFKHPFGEDRKSFYRLVGFFVGDGCALNTRANGIEFRLCKHRKVEYLRELAESMGLELSAPTWGYVLRGDGIGHWFREHCYSGEDKILPKWVFDLGEDDAACILDGLKNSDGHDYKRSAGWVYSTTSPVLSEQVVQLGIHAGEAVNGPHEKPIRGRARRQLFTVEFFSPVTKHPVINTCEERTHSSMVQYSGKVYCAKTRTGILMVRRNKKTCLSGNTTWFWTTDLRNLMNFLQLRLHSHAQWELRMYAQAIMYLIEPMAPIAVRAFRDFVFEGEQ